MHYISTPLDAETPLAVKDFCCGNGKKCPLATAYHDRLVITDEGQRIAFTREQAVELRSWLESAGF